MLVYILLFGFIISLGIIQYSANTITIRTPKKHQLSGTFFVFVLSFLSITFVEAMRNSTVGEDLKGYLSFFEFYRQKPLNTQTLLDFSAFEPGFMLLYKAIGTISTTDRSFIIASSIVIVFLNLYFLYKNSEDYYLSILLFFGFNHFFTSMVSLRQYIAISIVMWILPLLREKKIVKAVLVSILAFFFHMTSVIPVVFIFFAHALRKHKKIIPWVVLAALLLMPFANHLFNYFSSFILKYSLTEGYKVTSAGRIGYLRIIYILLEISLIIITYLNKRFVEEEYTSYSILLVPAIACGLLTSIPWLFRVGYYFDYFMLLLIPKIISNMPKSRSILRIGTIVVAAVFFMYYLSINPGETVPYVFYP